MGVGILADHGQRGRCLSTQFYMGTKKDRRMPVLAKRSQLNLADFGFCGFNHFAEAGRIMNGDLGKHLAVEFNT